MSVNVGTFMPAGRQEGATVQSGGSSGNGRAVATAGKVFDGALNGQMQTVTIWMWETGRDGKKRTAAFVFASTQLASKRLVKWAVSTFEQAKYDCEETHGAAGIKRRETASVMICVDNRQLMFLRVQLDSKSRKRVVDGQK